jgi:uncharacterized membrane protein YhfC
MDIAIRILNFTLMIAMPIALASFLSRRLKTAWRLFGIGVATFFLSQVLHIPFNLWVLNPLVQNMNLEQNKPGFQLVLFGLIYGLSAGVFEEVFRFLGYKVWIKNNRDWKSSLMYGAGHGGIESILLGILALYAFIQVMILRDMDLSLVVPPDQVGLAQGQLEAYWNAPWHMTILGAVERFSAIIFHLSATVLVLQAFHKRNILWLGLAVGWHTLLDASAVFAAQSWSPYVAEAIILVFGLLSLGIIFLLRTEDEEALILHDEPYENQPITIQEITPSEENLEDSKYA